MINFSEQSADRPEPTQVVSLKQQVKEGCGSFCIVSPRVFTINYPISLLQSPALASLGLYLSKK